MKSLLKGRIPFQLSCQSDEGHHRYRAVVQDSCEAIAWYVAGRHGRPSHQKGSTSRQHQKGSTSRQRQKGPAPGGVHRASDLKLESQPPLKRALLSVCNVSYAAPAPAVHSAPVPMVVLRRGEKTVGKV